MHAWNAIEVDDRGYISLVSTTPDGKRFRERYLPGDDLTEAPAIIQAAVSDIWTADVIAAEDERRAEAKAESDRVEAEAKAEQESRDAAAAEAEAAEQTRIDALVEAAIAKRAKAGK